MNETQSAYLESEEMTVLPTLPKKSRTLTFARLWSGQGGIPAHIVSVETDLSRGLHAFSIVGLADKAVDEARDRVSAAIKNSGFDSPKQDNHKIVVSLAPADIKKEGTAFDFPVALAYLLASELISFEPEGKIFLGELSLDGALRPIKGALSIAIAAREKGMTEMYVPKDNAEEVSLIPGLTIFPVETLAEAIDHLSGDTRKRIASYVRAPKRGRLETDDLSDIRGQETAKRGLEIAIAGGHNIALWGPPGTGKTMLARAAASLLPSLSEEEMIEVTSIHSLAGTVRGVITEPPFRSPHHTSSYPSLIGGGNFPRPGEVTLAHRGVLFLDEFPEFHRDVINALREPLEDARITVARARGTCTFPANFILIAALNPCPCGKAGSNDCKCLPLAIEKYKRKISGPIADRIDMWTRVGAIPLESLSVKRETRPGESAAARERIQKARTVQANRFTERGADATNADMSAKDIASHAGLTPSAEKSLVDAALTLKLSPRGYHRTIKVARTIADLSGSEIIEVPHMLEALQYRLRDL